MPATRSPASRKRDGQSDPCPICQVRTARQADMARHMRSHDSYENKRYQCPYCEYRSSVKDAFRAHVNKHEDKTVDCNEDGCTAKFRDRSSLSRHRSKWHKGIKPKPRPKKSQPTKGPNWVNAYPKISFVPQHQAQPASLARVSSVTSILSSPSETSGESDEELLTPALSMSPGQQDVYAYSVMNEELNLSQFNPASSNSELFASTCDDKLTCTSDLSMPHPNYAVTDFYGSVPQEPYMPGALQDSFSDFSFDMAQGEPDWMGFADTSIPLTRDGYASNNTLEYPNPMAMATNGNGLFDLFQQSCLTPDGLFPFQHQTTESDSLSAMMALGSSSSTGVNPMDTFLQPYAQTQTQKTGDTENVVQDPLQDLDFSWFTQAPAPAAGYIF